MRKLYNEFFYIPKYGKIREKVMLARVATSVVITVICLAAISITTYAYFSSNVTSAPNIIQTATFETQVKVQLKNENGEAVDVIKGKQKSFTAELKANTEYYITLQHTEKSTAKTGYVIITAEKSGSRYHTQQIGKDANGKTETVTFWLKPTEDTKVTFLSCWGTSSLHSEFTEIGENSEKYIVKGEHVALSITETTDSDSTSDNMKDIEVIKDDSESDNKGNTGATNNNSSSDNTGDAGGTNNNSPSNNTGDPAGNEEEDIVLDLFDIEIIR